MRESRYSNYFKYSAVTAVEGAMHLKGRSFSSELFNGIKKKLNRSI